MGASRDIKVLKRSETGPSWYPKPGPDRRFDTGREFLIEPGEDALFQALQHAGAGDIIALAPGDYTLRKTLLVNRPVTIRSRDAENRANISFERTALAEIADGGSLKLSGLNISGKSAPDVAGNSVVRTSRYSMLNNFVLQVENSTVADLDTNHSFNFFSAAKHTFADRISIVDSDFRNVTGHVLYLNREDEDLGIYNAEYVLVKKSSFQNIAGTLADIYRGGTDESTFGPHFELAASTLENVGKGKRNKSGASVHLLGVQATNIHGNTFRASQPMRIVETVGEPVTRISDNRFEATPPALVGPLGSL